MTLSDSPDADTKLRRHDAIWVKRIKAALMEQRFRLAHLPIAGLRSDSLAMYDMLVRMIDEQGKSDTAVRIFAGCGTQQPDENHRAMDHRRGH